MILPSSIQMKCETSFQLKESPKIDIQAASAPVISQTVSDFFCHIPCRFSYKEPPYYLLVQNICKLSLRRNGCKKVHLIFAVGHLNGFKVSVLQTHCIQCPGLHRGLLAPHQRRTFQDHTHPLRHWNFHHAPPEVHCPLSLLHHFHWWCTVWHLRRREGCTFQLDRV